VELIALSSLRLAGIGSLAGSKAIMWELTWGNLAAIGAHCNGCGHKHRWAIEALITQHQPWTTVLDLAERWKCSRCGSRDVVPFAIGR
jgi:hypothetical protein